MSIGIFIALVAGAVFLLIQGLAVPAFGDQARARRKLKRRLSQIETELGGQSTASLMREKYLRELSPLQRELESLPMMEALARMIDQTGSGLLAHQLDVGPDVKTAGLDAAGILRQPAYAMPVRPLQVGFRHQGGHRHGVGRRQAQPNHRFLDERLQPVKGDGQFLRQDRHSGSKGSRTRY